MNACEAHAWELYNVRRLTATTTRRGKLSRLKDRHERMSDPELIFERAARLTDYFTALEPIARPDSRRRADNGTPYRRGIARLRTGVRGRTGTSAVVNIMGGLIRTNLTWAARAAADSKGRIQRPATMLSQ